MIAVGIGLIAMAVAGTVAGGLIREIASPRRAVLGILTATAIVWVCGLSFGLSFADMIPVVAFAAIPLAVGTFIDRLISSKTARAWVSLVVELGCVMSIGIISATVGADGRWLQSLLSRLPYPGLAEASAEAAVLLVGVLLWLGPVANAVVRMVLTAAGADPESSEQKLRGGRIIGILERWLILGFVLSGQPTAAALTVSAKSILRFPELNEKARSDSDEKDDLNTVTEYLLLGSLASWTLALLAAALF